MTARRLLEPAKPDRGLPGGSGLMYGERIPIKTRARSSKMRVATRHVAEILLELREMVKPGVTTAELDRHAEKTIKERGVVVVVQGL